MRTEKKTQPKEQNKGNHYCPMFFRIPTIEEHTVELIEPMLLLRGTK